MKTSNKILLALFLGLVLIVSALHIGLYAKYKAGKITPDANSSPRTFKTYELSNVKYLYVTGLEYCSIIPDDSAQVTAWRAEDSRLLIRVVQDTLFIYGDSLMSQPGYNQTRRVYQQVSLYLPEMKMIKGTNTEFQFVGSGDTTRALHYNIQLHDASVRVAEVRDAERPASKSYFKSFTIRAARSSHVDLAPNAMIGNLDIALEESMLNDHEASIDSIQLTIDEKSEIVLHGANLKKVNLTNK